VNANRLQNKTKQTIQLNNLVQSVYSNAANATISTISAKKQFIGLLMAPLQVKNSKCQKGDSRQ